MEKNQKKGISEVKKMIIASLSVALCVVLPLAFHSVQNAGVIFSPIHIPVFICAIITGWPYGLLCGILGPILSSILTGMPGGSILGPMIIELASYGFITGLLSELIHTKSMIADIYISLIGGMLGGRAIAGIVKALIFSKGSYSFNAFITSYFITSWPGILIQLTLSPAIIIALQAASLIPRRYPTRPRSVDR